MAHAAIGLNGLQPLEVETALAAQIALDQGVALLKDVHDLGQLVLVQVLGAGGRVDASLLHDLRGDLGPDAIDVAQRDVDALVGRNVYSDDSGHCLILSFNPDAACGAGWSYK